MNQIFAYYNIKHITLGAHYPTGQEVIGRPNCTFEYMIHKQKVVTKSSRDRLHSAL